MAKIFLFLKKKKNFGCVNRSSINIYNPVRSTDVSLRNLLPTTQLSINFATYVSSLSPQTCEPEADEFCGVRVCLCVGKERNGRNL